MPTLYPQQQAAVDKAISRSNPVRAMYSFATGCGKTPTAITTAAVVGASRILIICPAIVRGHWAKEIAAWWPARANDVGIIDVGRERKISKKAAVIRDLAYAAPIQVTSFDLLGELNPHGWDFIICDEAHGLGNPLSAQSRMVSALFDANPVCHALMLTATPIPTVIKQIWHPLYLLEDSAWGKPSNTGDVSWEFGRAYCGIVRSEYGTMIGNNPKPEQLEKLRADLVPVMSRLTMEDVAPNMPPLCVSALYTKKADDKFYKEFIKSLPTDIHHACILTHLKATAARIQEIAIQLGWEVIYVDGSIQATRRYDMLSEWAAQPKAILIGTYDSMATGIRLTAAQCALICEFSASPGTTAQVLGRFASVGTNARPSVQVVIQAGEEHLRSALFDRVTNVNTAIRGSGNETAILAAFAEQELTSDDIGNLFGDIFGNANDTSDWLEGGDNE